MKQVFSFLLSFQSIITFSQVNLQTGAAQINIPIYSYSNNDGLITSISLNYFDGNGLKVSEAASSTGTGWNLLFGGVIIREQRGLPDDQCRSLILQNPLPSNISMTYNEYYTTYFPNGYLFSYYSPSDNISNEGGYIKMLSRHYSYLSYPGKPTVSVEDNNIPSTYTVFGGNSPENEAIVADREQDIFHLSFGNRTLDFVIGKNNQIKVLNDSKVKIELSFSNMLGQNIKTRIDKFIVTNEQGIQYIFSDKELSQSCTYSTKRFTGITNTINLDENNAASPGGYYGQGNTAVIGTIPIFIGKKTPEFIVSKWYLSQIINPRTNKSITFNYDHYDIDIPTQRIVSCMVQNGSDDKISVTILREVIKALRISTIVCSPTTTINFSYEPIPRVDFPNEKPLSEIKISENNTLIKKYSFQYGYFFTSVIRPYNYQFTDDEKFATRLCLKSIQQIGSDNVTSEAPYVFDYYTGNDQNVGIYYSDIVPSMNSYWTDHWGYFNSQGINKNEYKPNEILYPAAYSFMSVTASGSKAPVDGLAKNGIIKQIIYPLGGTLLYEYEQNDAFFNNQNVIAGGVRVKTITQFDGINHNNDIIKDFKYTKEDGLTSSGWGYETPTYSMNRSMRIYRESGGKSGANFKDYARSFKTSVVMKSFGAVSAMILGTSVVEALVGAVSGALFAVVVQILVDLFTPSEPAWRDESQTEYTNIRYESANPLPYQYSRVEVIEKKLNGNNGKTVYEFTSDQYYPITIPTFAFPFSNKDRYVKWAYGLPKRISVYNNNIPAQIQRETINEYNTIASSFVDANFMSKKWEPNKFTIDAFPSSHSQYLNQSGNVTETIYYPQVGHSELATKKERVYDKNGIGYSEMLTTYIYNSNNFQPNQITTTNSSGDVIQKRIYYPEDFSLGGFISDLKNANIVNIPISSESWITKSGGQPQLINANATEFTIIANGDIKPSKIYSLESTAPVSQSALQPFNPNSIIRDPNYIKEQQQYVYDNSGNLIQTISKAKTASVLYDYIGTRASMKITNASPSEFAYTSFEADNKGGWNFNTANLQQQIVPTGKMGYQLSGGSISTNVVISKPSILSFWSTNNNVQINGSFSPTKTVSGIQGWTYYEFELPTNSTSPVITGNTVIDELRLYPKNSRMITTTYDDVGNISSECDANNHIVYYEYDGLGRILLVRDQNRNVLKKYCYNYAGQVENCNILYGNIEKSGIFTRNNCAATHTGGQIVYYVYPGTYTSGISADIANQQAQNDVNINGQNWANINGPCIPNIIYAKLNVENQSYNQGDVVVRFYEDQACTIPYSV